MNGCSDTLIGHFFESPSKLTKRGGANGYKISTVMDSKQLSCYPWVRLKTFFVLICFLFFFLIATRRTLLKAQDFVIVLLLENEAVVTMEIELLSYLPPLVQINNKH